MDGAIDWWHPAGREEKSISNYRRFQIRLIYLQIKRPRFYKVVQINERGHHETSEYRNPTEKLRGALIELHGKCDASQCSYGRMGCIVCQRLEQRVLRQLNEVVAQQARYGNQGSEHNAHIDHGVTMRHRLHLALCLRTLVLRVLFLVCVRTELMLPIQIFRYLLSHFALLSRILHNCVVVKSQIDWLQNETSVKFVKC